MKKKNRKPCRGRETSQNLSVAEKALVPVGVSSARGVRTRPRGWPLVPVQDSTGTKGWSFSPDCAVPVAQPGLKPATNQAKSPVFH